jgi:hypothetical protein
MRPAFEDPGGLLQAGDSGFRLRCGNEAGTRDAGGPGLALVGLVIANWPQWGRRSGTQAWAIELQLTPAQ